MYIKDIILKNFLSYGDQPTRYVFDKHNVTLIYAKNGKGKCVDKSTQININFSNDVVKQKFIGFVENNELIILNGCVDTTIGQITDFYKAYPECVGMLSVETQYGYYPILAAEITAYDSQVYQITTSNGKVLKCSPEHRLLSNQEWVYTKDFSIGDNIHTIDGIETVQEIKLLDYTDDLYDIEVAEKHEYYSNGIVSHNSSIIDALHFVAFGKAFRNIKKDLLVNTDNKRNMSVEMNLIGNNGKDVKVIRGMKPNRFEIYEDGVLVDQFAESKDYQTYLETFILGMNSITFSQTVIISKTKYTPFMRLRVPDRRAFVESVLNIEIFGDMQKLQAKSVSGLKEVIVNSEYELKLHSGNIQAELRILKNMVDMVKKAKDESQINRDRELNEAKQSILMKKEEINKLKESIYNDDYIDDYNKRLALDKKAIEYDSKIKMIRGNIKTASQESGKCTLCGNDVDISHIEDHIKALNDELNKAEILKFKISNKIIQLDENYNLHINRKENNNLIHSQISRLHSDISDLENKIVELENRVIDTSEYDQQISDLKVKIRAMKVDESNLSEKINADRTALDRNTMALAVLKDGGIKSSIINNSIPTINAVINEYLHKFGFFIMFNLNSDFEESIKYKNIDYLVYDSFSEGEKLRIDLALIFAWRKIAMIQSGTSCNLLFFDEITDASMDDEGVDLFIKSLNSLTDTNTWIISHTPEKIETYVRGVINLDKVNGFTVITKNK